MQADASQTGAVLLALVAILGLPIAALTIAVLLKKLFGRNADAKGEPATRGELADLGDRVHKRIDEVEDYARQGIHRTNNLLHRLTLDMREVMVRLGLRKPGLGGDGKAGNGEDGE